MNKKKKTYEKKTQLYRASVKSPDEWKKELEKFTDYLSKMDAEKLENNTYTDAAINEKYIVTEDTEDEGA